MGWLPYILASTEVTPLGTAASDIVSYILGYGAIGVIALAFAFRYIVPRGAVEAARADLIAENKRLREEKAHAEEQRDEALRIARDQVVPLLISFNSTTGSLLPLLQEIVRYREVERGHGPGRHG